MTDKLGITQSTHKRVSFFTGFFSLLYAEFRFKRCDPSAEKKNVHVTFFVHSIFTFTYVNLA